jgi:hypothetical protein
VVRTLPLQHFGRGPRVREPQRHAVVVGDCKPQSLGGESKTADGRRNLDGFRLALAGHHIGRLARRPRQRAVRPGGDMIDPAVLGIGGDELAVAVGAGDEHFAVVAARRDPSTIARRRENATAMNSDPLLIAVVGNQMDRLLAEHEGRGAAKEIYCHHQCAAGDRAGALDHGGGAGGGVSHYTVARLALFTLSWREGEARPTQGMSAKPRRLRSLCGSCPRPNCGR